MLRALAFGDLALESWGTILSPGAGLPSFAVLGGERGVVTPVTVRGDPSPAADWWVTGEGLALTVAPGSNGETASTEHAGFDQLVAVRGELASNGVREADLLGCRSARGEELKDFRLLRDICAWFSPSDGLAVLAMRPRRAASHGDEWLSATLIEGGEPRPIEEARLSTTYSEDGLPIRASLELWLPETDEQDEQAVAYARRAAGEAAAPATRHELDGLELQVRPFRWRAGGREGAGIYLIARTR
jgi:hypothetical protein